MCVRLNFPPRYVFEGAGIGAQESKQIIHVFRNLLIRVTVNDQHQGLKPMYGRLIHNVLRQPGRSCDEGWVL